MKLLPTFPCNQKRRALQPKLQTTLSSWRNWSGSNTLLLHNKPPAPSPLLAFFPQSSNLYIHSSYYIHSYYPCTIDWTDQRFNIQSSFTKWSSKYSLWSSVHPLTDQIFPHVCPLRSGGTRSPFSIHTERL
jgi:hypothetical protein